MKFSALESKRIREESNMKMPAKIKFSELRNWLINNNNLKKALFFTEKFLTSLCLGQIREIIWKTSF